MCALVQYSQPLMFERFSSRGGESLFDSTLENNTGKLNSSNKPESLQADSRRTRSRSNAPFISS